MSRALKIKQSTYGALGSVVGVNFSNQGSYTVAPSMSFALSLGGEQAQGVVYMQYNPILVGIFMTGTETVAYQAGVPWIMPTTPGALNTPWFSPGLDTPQGYAGDITGTTGVNGQVSLAGGINMIKGQSVTITAGAMGGLINGQTYYVLTSNGGAASVQLTGSYAAALAGIATLTTVVAAGAADFTLGTFANTAGAQWTIINPTHLGAYITLPTGVLNVNIPGGGQGLTTTASAMSWQLGPYGITNPGSGYTAPPAITFTGGTGSGAVATAVMGQATTPTGTGLVDIGFNPFNYLDSPTQVIPTGMTEDQYLGVVGGGFDGGVATPANPTVKCTAWIQNAPAEDDAYIVTQKGATRYLVAGSTNYAVTTTVPGRTYLIASLGDTKWNLVGASVNPRVGDVFTATAVGTGTGTVAYAGTCSLSNVAAGSVTQGNMQITVTTNSVAFRASRLTNKYVWNYATPPIKYATAFFAGSAGAVTTAKAGAEADTFVNGTGAMLLGQVTNYTS
jgi:hypothetical protein